MNITFEEADKIREALKPGAKQNERYEAIGILDAAEQKQREKNAKTIAYIQAKRKEDKNYARPDSSWVITVELKEGKKTFERVGDIDELRERMKKQFPNFKAIKYYKRTFKK